VILGQFRFLETIAKQMHLVGFYIDFYISDVHGVSNFIIEKNRK
jgi:hypothetical protein